MPWGGWVTLIAAVIGTAWAIDSWILPKPIIRPLILRLLPKGEKPFHFIANLDTSFTPRAQIPTPPTGTGRVTVTIDYFDGLPEAAPQIRNPFLEGQKLEREYKYLEAIKLYEACFQPESTASQRVALYILIGNCFLSLSAPK